MFRIDRRLVNLSNLRINKQGADEKSEVGAEGDLPDAATSAEILVNEYLNAAEAEVNAKANEILENARDQAAEIIYQAREDAEETHKKAWQEGFEEGSSEGRRTYEAKLEEKIREDDEALKNVIDEIYEERERTYSELEEEVTKLSVEIVRKIINPAEEALNDVFISMIKNAMRQMSTDSKIVIRVGAVEYERFFSSGTAVLELDSGVTVKASVMRDVSLNDGDLIIDTDDVTINAGLESQLQYVELAFERAKQNEPN